MMSRQKQPGFTLLELLFAIVLMGTMLSIALVAIIGMLRFYVFSNQVRQNQENGRNILDTITREIRFGELILPNDGTPRSDRVCVLDKSNNQLIQYRFSAPNLLRSTYTYSPAIPPKDCVVKTGEVAIRSAEKPINLDTMQVVSFKTTKTQGAEIEVNTDVAAVVLNLSYITGQHDPADSSKCKIADIYCSGLELNTAINIRGKDSQ